MAAWRSTAPPNYDITTAATKRALQATKNPTPMPVPRKPLHDHLEEQAVKLCNIFIESLEQYAELDPAIASLLNKALAVKKLPELKRLRIALLGEQAAGKSSLINALLARMLLDTSAGSIACTAFCTIINYKEGAADDTLFSNVKIELLLKGELRLFVNDLIERYADYQAASPDEKDKALEDNAKTAEEFFSIIFNVDEVLAKKEWLQERLNAGCVLDDDFPSQCLEHAARRMKHIESELKARDGLCLELDVHDKDLPRKRDLAKKIWPFVKTMTISTGHPLLRAGISFLDLPGNVPDPQFLNVY